MGPAPAQGAILRVAGVITPLKGQGQAPGGDADIEVAGGEVAGVGVDWVAVEGLPTADGTGIVLAPLAGVV